jgi:hypothetical protein
MIQAEKLEMKGIKFVQPLQFGDWPLKKIEGIIGDIKGKYSNFNDFELLGVNRGGYNKCQGYGEHKPCDELIESYGSITFIRKGMREITTYGSV